MQRCPECDQPLSAQHINLNQGMALCPGCGQLSRLSELNLGEGSVIEVLQQPPSGCLVQQEGQAVRVTATTRSIGSFLGLLAMSLFWNGIVSVFLVVALAGLYTNLVGPIPDWFPAPKMDQGKPEMNGEPMGLGMTLFLCLFLTPFVTVGAGMIVATLMCLMGKVEVIIDEMGSHVGTGIGFLAWKRRFRAQDVQSVEMGQSSYNDDGRRQRLIEITVDRLIQFGSMLPADRMQWMKVVLKELLLGSGKSRPNSTLPKLYWLSRK